MKKADIARAMQEITDKTQAQINADTAWTWAARAVAYRHIAEKTVEGSACDLWRGFDDARHEALEHASLVGDGGKLVGRIECAIDAPLTRKRWKKTVH